VNSARFQDEFLESIAVAFRKRASSIRHRASRMELSKVYELVDREKVERLEIDLLSVGKTSLRLHAWPDRLIWLDARRPTKKGWTWSWTYEGRLLASTVDVIASMELSLDLLAGMETSRTGELDQLWVRLLARGPREAL